MMRGHMRGYFECDDAGSLLQIRRILRSWGAAGSLETRDQHQSTRRCEMAINTAAGWQGMACRDEERASLSSTGCGAGVHAAH